MKSSQCCNSKLISEVMLLHALRTDSRATGYRRMQRPCCLVKPCIGPSVRRDCNCRVVSGQLNDVRRPVYEYFNIPIRRNRLILIRSSVRYADRRRKSLLELHTKASQLFGHHRARALVEFRPLHEETKLFATRHGKLLSRLSPKEVIRAAHVFRLDRSIRVRDQDSSCRSNVDNTDSILGSLRVGQSLQQVGAHSLAYVKTQVLLRTRYRRSRQCHRESQRCQTMTLMLDHYF